MPAPVRLLRTRAVTVIASLWFLVVPGASASAQEAGPPDLAIVNVHVVDVRAGRVLPERTVLVRDGAIVDVSPSGPAGPPPAASVVDGTGAWLIPGLWDMHVHLRGSEQPAWTGTDWLMPLFLAHGVTGVREMASDCDGPEQGPVCIEELLDWRARIEAGELLGPRLVALSSFPLNPPWDYRVTEEQARQVVAALDERGVENLKIYHRLAPEALAWILDEAASRGMDAWGHVPLRMTVAEAAAAGLRSVEHARDFLIDCYPGTAAFRAEALAPDPPVDEVRRMVREHEPARCEETFRALVRHDTAYVPTHLTRRMEAFAGDSAFRADPRARYVPALYRRAWSEDADRVVARDPTPAGRAAYRAFYEQGLALTGAAHRAGVRVLLGTDAGDSFSFPGSGAHDELEELVAAGLSSAEALRAATLGPAEFLGLEARHGAVEAGMRADLVLLEGDPLIDIGSVRRIRAVVFGGELLDRNRLNGLLLQAERAAARPLGP